MSQRSKSITPGPVDLKVKVQRGAWKPLLKAAWLVAPFLGLNAAVAAEENAPAPEPIPQPSPEPSSSLQALSPSTQSGAIQAEAFVVRGASYQADRSASNKFTAPLLNLPQTVTIIPRKVLDDQGASSLQDAVRNVPGITLNAGEGGSTPGDQFNLRGFSARDDIFVDGLRSGGGYQRDSFNLEQVEVVKGPGSVYSGHSGVGGTINLVTKAPKRTAEGGIKTSVGMDNSIKRAELDINEPLKSVENAAFRLSAMREDSGVPGRDEVTKSGWGIAPSLGFGLGEATRLRLNYYALRQDNVPDYGIPAYSSSSQFPRQVVPVDPSNYYGLKDIDHERVTVDQANLSLEHDLQQDITLRANLGWLRSDTDRVVSFIENVSPTATNPYNRSTKSHVTNDESFQASTDLSAKLGKGFLKHSINAGLEYSRQVSRFGRATLGTPPAVADINNPNPWDTYTGVYSQAHSFTRGNANDISAFAFDTLSLGQHWDVDAGLRQESYQPEVTEIRAATSNDITPVAQSNMTSWKAGLVYKPLPFASLYVAAGNSFNPSGQGLAYDGSNANAILPPEESRSYELGTKWDLFKQRLSLSLAAFRNEKFNARTDDPSDPSLQILDGNQRVDGVEVGASGSPFKALNVFAGWTGMDGHYIRSNVVGQEGALLPNIPKNNWSLWGDLSLPWGFQVGGGARYSDSRTIDYRWDTTVPGYHVYDALLAWKHGNTTLRANFYNLADEIYYLQPRFWVRGQARSTVLSAEIKF